MPATPIRRLWPLLLSLLMLSCQKDDPTAGGSVEENEVLAGTLVFTDGKPAADAIIRFYPIDYQPAKANGAPKITQAEDLAFSTRTDAKGHYHVDSLAKGEYNILAEDTDGQVAFRDSVFLVKGVVVQVSDTLRDPGSLRGTVALQPNHDPRTATVQVLGTNVFANVDSAGRFTLPGLAAGQYTLRTSTTVAQYTALYTPVIVRAGKDDSLPDRLQPTYTGIPVVSGLRVRLDTLAGLAVISWNKVRFRDFRSYVVLKSGENPIVPLATGIGVTNDTFWVDTLFRPGTSDFGLESGILPPPVGLEYLIKVRNQSRDDGESYGSANLSAVPPSWAQTHIDFEMAGTLNGDAARGDTVKIIARFRNQTRGFKKVLWRLTGQDDPVRDKDLPPGSGNAADTLVVTQNQAGLVQAYCQVVDDAGKIWTQITTVRFVVPIPIALPGPDTAVWRGGQVKLHGSGTSRFGKIVKYEWDVGATGNFQMSADGTLEFTAPNQFTTVPCVLRVTNEYGETGASTLHINVIRIWEKVRADLPFKGDFGQAVFWKNKIWMIGGVAGSTSTGSIFSTEDGVNWKTEKEQDNVTTRLYHAAIVYKDELFVLGGTERNTGVKNEDFWASTDGETWSKVPLSIDRPEFGISVIGYFTRIAEFKGQLWLFPPQNSTSQWSSSDGRFWQYQPPVHLRQYQFTGGYSVAVFDNHLVSIESESESFGHAENGTDWISGSMGVRPKQSFPSLAVYEDALWVIGGSAKTCYTEHDLGSWHDGPSFPVPIGSGSVSYVFQNILWTISNGTLWRLR